MSLWLWKLEKRDIERGREDGKDKERERERERKREREKEIKYGETSIGTNPMNSSAPKLAELETIYNRKNWIFCHFVHTGGQ